MRKRVLHKERIFMQFTFPGVMFLGILILFFVVSSRIARRICVYSFVYNFADLSLRYSEGRGEILITRSIRPWGACNIKYSTAKKRATVARISAFPPPSSAIFPRVLGNFSSLLAVALLRAFYVFTRDRFALSVMLRAEAVSAECLM